MATKTRPASNGHTNRIADAMPGGPVASVTIPRPNIIRLRCKIESITPLLICRFDLKTQQKIKDTMGHVPTNKKGAKDLGAECDAARYISTEGWDGFNAVTMRAAMISAARSVEGLTMTALKQGIFVKAEGQTPDGVPLIQIHGKRTRFDNMCRTTTGVAYPRARPMYNPWSATIDLEVNGHILSAEAAVNLLSLAGQFCGIGEWRPTATKSFTGDYGRFAVKSFD